MADNSLIKSWIQFLKNNQIVGMQSDPKTGKLNYKRPVTTDDVTRFLDKTGKFSDEQISNAIHMVLAKKSIANRAPELGYDPNAGKQSTNIPQIGHDPNSVSDVDYRETPRTTKQLPNPQRRLQHDPNSVSDIDFRMKDDDEEDKKNLPPRRVPRLPNNSKVNEDIRDTKGPEFDENDIEDLFSMLGSMGADGSEEEPAPQKSAGRSNAAGRTGRTGTAKQKQDADGPNSKKVKELRQLKRVIRDSMSDSQRAMLFKMLKKQSVTESEMSDQSVEDVFQAAVEIRQKPGFLGKYIKSLQKDKIDINDLQQAWKEAGYTDESGDIANILRSHGFSTGEIKKAFSTALGKDNKGNIHDTKSIASLQKIAKYIIDNGLQNDVLAYLQTTYKLKEDFGYDKVTIEDVRKIFTLILQEERANRIPLLNSLTRDAMGRDKKSRVDELVNLHDVLKADQYVKLLHKISAKAGADINLTRIKNHIIQSWKKGMTSRKHYNALLNKVDLNIHDLISE